MGSVGSHHCIHVQRCCATMLCNDARVLLLLTAHITDVSVNL
jgi:hypothetical protein